MPAKFNFVENNAIILTPAIRTFNGKHCFSYVFESCSTPPPPHHFNSLVAHADRKLCVNSQVLWPGHERQPSAFETMTNCFLCFVWARPPNTYTDASVWSDTFKCLDIYDVCAIALWTLRSIWLHNLADLAWPCTATQLCIAILKPLEVELTEPSK